MYKDFKNEFWLNGEEKDFYLRTLKSVRFHKPLERIDAPTTTLLFVSRLTDPSIRQHFEDSSRHFKTYNLYTEITDFFSVPGESEQLEETKTPEWFFVVIENIFRVPLLKRVLSRFLSESQSSYLAYRKKLKSMTVYDLVNEIALLYQTMGLINLTKLNVIVSINDERNVRYGIRFLSQVLNDPSVKEILANKNILIPNDYQTLYGDFCIKKNKIRIGNRDKILSVNDSLLHYLEKKTTWVMEKVRVKDLVKAKSTNDSRTLIIGRRILTRGQVVLNENCLIQSYDYKHDMDFKFIQRILKKFLQSFKAANVGALILIENYPAHISELIARDDDLKRLLHGNDIALACVEPDSKDIYTFEGDQFIQKSLKQIY